MPSEAQGEYACRAGTRTEYHFGEKLPLKLANYGGHADQTSAAGSCPANRWGLHDLHGNVWEWRQDHWHKNYEGLPGDGRAWLSSVGVKAAYCGRFLVQKSCAFMVVAQQSGNAMACYSIFEFSASFRPAAWHSGRGVIRTEPNKGLNSKA